MTTKSSHDSQTCGAKTRAGTPCQQRPIRGRNRCKYHGGMTPVAGPSHPTYKHGRYSKALPAALRQDYETALNDPELGELRDDLALLAAMINERLGRLDRGTEVPDEIADLVERKSRVAAREWKRVIDMRQVLTIESAMAMIDNLSMIILKHVDNPKTVRAIAADFQRICGPESSTDVEDGDE